MQAQSAGGQETVRVMLVEDDADLREAVAESLALLGHEVYAAATPSEARAVAGQWSPDAVVLDLLTTEPGLGLSASAAEPHDWGGAALVLASGSTNEHLAAAANRLGAAAVLRKPYGVDELLGRLRATRAL